MTENNIFLDSTQNQEGKQEQQVKNDIPVVPPELAEYVGEGKKYKSVQDVHKAFPHAQSRIATLEEENARIKAELEARKSTEALLEDIKKDIVPQNVVTPTPQVQMPDISSVVRQELERSEKEKLARTNQLEVVNKFKESFGDQAEVQFNKLAADLGVPIASLNALASSSPLALYKLAGIDITNKSTQSGNLQSDVRVPNQSAQTDDKVTVPRYANSNDITAAIRKARELIEKQYS